MALLYTLLLLVIPLVSLYFQFAISTGLSLEDNCSTNANCSTNTSNSECIGGICHCSATHYQQNNTCVVRKALGEACNANNSCTDVNAVCKENCTCKESFYQDITCKPKIPLGEICLTNASCSTYTSNSECIDDLCDCESTYFQQNNTCVAKKAFGEACNGTNECIDVNAVCIGNCTCKEFFYQDTTCKPRIYPNKSCGSNTSNNASCVANAYCNSTFCVCGVGNKATPTSCIPLRLPCSTNANCSTNNTNSECKHHTCHCAAKYYQQNNDCVLKKAFGEACNGTNECTDVHAVCIGNCTCKNSFYQDAFCKPRIYPKKKCGNSTPTNVSCVTNAFCNLNNVCVCDIGYTATATSCNSAMTMAVVEISAMIMCFMLAYLGGLK